MNKPKIRFKGFDGEWEKVKIGDFFQLCNGYAFKSDTYIKYGKYQIVTISNVQSGKLDLTQCDSIDLLPSNIANYQKLNIGDIILSMTGNVGRVCLVDQPDCLLNQRVGFLKPIKNSIDKQYAYCLINSKQFENAMIKSGQGAAQANISKNSIESFSFFVPSFQEQRKIAEYLTLLDTMIGLTEKKISSLKQVKQASLQQMFPQEGETTPRIRFKGFDGEWEKVKLGTLGTTYSGLSGKTKDDFGQGNAQYITFLNVLTNAQIDVSKLEQVNVKERQNAVAKGDILFNTSSETSEEVGLCSVMLDEIKNVYLNSFCFGFRPISNALDSKFLVYLMRGDIGRSIMKILAQGATRYNLSKNKLCEANVILPSLPEQQAIANYFTNLDKQIALHEARLEKLKSVKASCLDLMFV